MRPSLANRIGTACIAGLAVLLFDAIAPFALVLFLRDHGLSLLGAYRRFSHWGVATVLLAAATGFVLGADRTLALSHHALFSARPRDWPKSVAIWGALLACGALSVVAF